MKKIGIFAIEILVVILSVYAADILQNHFELIPDWLIHLPDVSYSRDDFHKVFVYVLSTYIILIFLGQLVLSTWKPVDARRTIDEVFLFAVAFSLSSMTLFVTTNVSFDPQLMVGIALCTTALIIIIYILASVLERKSDFTKNLLKSLSHRFFSIPGILILVLAISPGILAKLFVSNRDIANTITQIRIFMTQEDELPWTFVNALPDHQFSQPIALQFSPNDSSTLYVLQRDGHLYSVPWQHEGERKLLLDISDLVGYVEMENGALGFDLHPDFGNLNQYVYIYFTAVHDDEQQNHLARFDLSLGTQADRKASKQSLITWNRNNSGFHNGGSVEFGPDGFLYIAIGEMTDNDNHQRFDQTLVGGILRIDVDMKGGTFSAPISTKPATALTDNYYIPLDNPLTGEMQLKEYWAWGLRNPFRISFDRKNGALWAGDVGSTVWEEVNLIERGNNYQFPYIEGYESTGLTRPTDPLGREKSPIYTYKHTAYDRAVIGGIVYRGNLYPTLHGQYIFGDNYSGKVFILPAEKESVDDVETIARAPQYAQRGMTSLTETPQGDILLTTLGKMTESTGLILKLVPENEGDSIQLTSSKSAELNSENAINIFRTNCSRCHGSSGEADGPDSAHLGVTIPDFSSASFQSTRSDEKIRKVITDGGIASGLSPLMPPWGLVLDEAEIDAMISTIRQFGKHE